MATNNYFLESKMKVTPLSVEELKLFFGIMSLIQDYQFPSYKDHFKNQNDNLVKSKVAELMDSDRFHLILRNICLFSEISSFESLWNHCNYFINLLVTDFQPAENLILIIKKFKSQNAFQLKLLLLYDNTGYLLKGTVIKEKDMENLEFFQDKILNFLENFSGKNHTLIIPGEIFSMRFIELLREKHQFRCLSLRLLNNHQIYEESDLPYSLQTENFNRNNSSIIYCYNKDNGLITLKKDNPKKNNVIYLILGSSSFQDPMNKTSEDSEKNDGTGEQAYYFIEKIMRKIKVLWKFNVLKELDKEDLKLPTELLLFIFKAYMNNSYILYFSKMTTFIVYKSFIIEDLITSYKNNKKEEFSRSSKSVPIIEGHYPEKMNYCKQCIVCKRDAVINEKTGKKKIRKSKYRCSYCSHTSKKSRDVSLCVICFSLYHSNIQRYEPLKKTRVKVLKEKNCYQRKKKIEKIINYK